VVGLCVKKNSEKNFLKKLDFSQTAIYTSPMFVPATTSIRRSKVGNIDSDRLARRLNVLHDMFARPWDSFAHTTAARHRAAECWEIEKELMRRGFVSEFQLRNMREAAAGRVMG
jgi:hypothetical protein